MRRHATVLQLAFIAIATCAAPFCSADELDDFIAQKKRECVELTQKRDALQAAASRPGANVTPQVAERIATLSALVDASKTLLQQTPKTATEKQEFARTLTAIVRSEEMQARTIETAFGRAPPNAINRVATQLLEEAAAGGCTGKGASCAHHIFDAAPRRTGDDPMYRPMVNPYFETGGSGYKPTTAQEARDITRRYEGWQGGVVLEGEATLLGYISRIQYDRKLNALVLDDRLVYFVGIPPWTIVALCRAVAEKQARVAVSLGEVHTVLEKVLNGSDIAFDLKLTDKFLGDIVFARNEWLVGYKFADDYRPRTFSGDFNGAVLFAFNGFEFVVDQNIVTLKRARLDIRLVPLSKDIMRNGGLLPDFDAIAAGSGVPRQYLRNAEHIGEHVAYYRRDGIVERAFAYGEAAAFLRGLKAGGVAMERVIRCVEGRSASC